ncbi:MAG: FGGY-family carbohydrate kinase [Promethearchaeota archaeon]
MDEKNNKYILAIDHGTSGAKTAIVSMKGQVLDWAFEEVPLYLSEGGGGEQDPKEWWDAILKTAKRLIDKKTVLVEDIVGICNTSQWSGTVPVNEKGIPLMNAILWMDTRAAELTRKLCGGPISSGGYSIFKILRWLKRCGGGPSLAGVDTLSHILWLKQERPEIYNNTYKFLEPQDYINFKLTGKMAASYCSIHLHWVTDVRDPYNIKYSKKLIKKVKIDRNKLPELKKSIDVLGTISEEVAEILGLKKDTKVIMGAPDVQSAAIGSGAVGEYATHMYVGTSGWVWSHISQKKVNIIDNIGTVPSPVEGKFIFGNEQEIAGGTLSFLRDNILYHTDLLLIEQYKDKLDEVFTKLIKEISDMENLSETELDFIKQRLLNYEDELLHDNDIKNVNIALDKIALDLGKEQKIQGQTLEYLKEQFKKYKNEVLREAPLKNVYKLFDKIVERTPPGANKLIFTPWLYGQRAPRADDTLRGGLYNFSLNMTRGDLIRSIYEGVAYNTRWLFEAVENVVKKLKSKGDSEVKKEKEVIPELTIIGGGAKSDIWCQIFADVLNRNIKQVKDPIQANARGAAFIASVGLGYITWEDVSQFMEYSNIFTPNPENREIYDQLFKEFKNIYDMTKKMYKRLNS